jgi:hypothetical protein
MFQHLKHHSKILVTGPQRSGTTITARIIAHDTGHVYIDEEDISIRETVLLEEYLNSESNFVIHCPALSHKIHEFNNVLVVWCKRPLNEILASQKRIGWGEIKERTSYNALSDKRHIAQIKADWWDNYQCMACENWLEVSYHDLEEHELWVEDRVDWGVRQYASKD